MNNAFEIFGLEARPAIDFMQLRERYLQKAAILHPDNKGGNTEAFAELGVARALLEDPAERLHHLIQLRGGSAASSSVNEATELMDFAPFLLEAEQQIDKLQGASTSLAKALLVSPLQKCQSQLEAVERRIRLLMERLDREIQVLDQSWPHVPLAELSRVATSLRVVQKTQKEVSELLFQLRSEVAQKKHLVG